MKLRVQQLIQPLTAASNAGVVEFDFECLEFLKERFHKECVLCGLASCRIERSSSDLNSDLCCHVDEERSEREEYPLGLPTLPPAVIFAAIVLEPAHRVPHSLRTCPRVPNKYGQPKRERWPVELRAADDDQGGRDPVLVSVGWE